jgi:ribonuclease R
LKEEFERNLMEDFERRKKLIESLVKDPGYVPMKAKELAILLQVPRESRSELTAVLDSLVAEGRVALTKRGKYVKPEMLSLEGTFDATRKGFGFVVVDGMDDDIFISEGDVNGAFHGDRVKVVVTKQKRNGKRMEGKVIQVFERGIKHLVGSYEDSGTFGFVVPDNGRIACDIFIPREKSMNAVSGHKVVVELTDYGKNGRNPEGRIVEIIGHSDDPGTDVMSIIKAYELPVDFPCEVKSYVEGLPDEVGEKDKEGRLDLRGLQTVTIDGEDAKDLDDAITLSKSEENGKVRYHLGVHIADVSHYVREKSPLDKEALKRGTSVYLVDRVIPMLPRELSNGICSLNQGTDRLALSCLMDIDGAGNVVGHRIEETLINVDRRMTYTSVKKILVDGDEGEIAEYSELVPMFRLMEELAAILGRKRTARGAIDFDFPETKILLDDKGVPLEVKPYERNVATRIIEEFMLCANETVAEEYYWNEIPFLYRSHENPDPEKIQSLSVFVNNFGYSIRKNADGIRPKELQKLLKKISGTQEEALISKLTLRSMQRARYTTECKGHFGLAAKYYCHFTSPIRRYPDLQIHRIIKDNLHGRMDDGRLAHYGSILDGVADQTSKTERRADDAERDTDKLKMTQYMEAHIGEEFDGVISGMTSWGIYVELPNTIEGMVSVSALKDGHYTFDENHYEMVNNVTNNTYVLGQKVRVKVVNTDRVLRTIDFEFISKEATSHGKTNRRKKADSQ